jgi:PAS domain S-box-containing protein
MEGTAKLGYALRGAWMTSPPQTRVSSELRYQALLEHLKVAMFVSRLDGRLLEVTPRFVEMWGYPDVESCLKLNGRELYSNPEDRELAVEELRRNGVVRNFEFRMQRAAGDLFWASVSAALIDLGNGEEPLILGIIEDINDRRRERAAREAVEQQLRQSEARFRLIAEQTMLGLSILQDGQIRYVNQAVADANGYTLEELARFGFEDFARLIHPDDLPFLIEQARKKDAKDPTALQRYDYRLITKTGKVKWLEEHWRAIEYEGRPASLISTVDMTSRKEAELSLAAEKERLAVTLRSIADGVITTDDDARVVSINRAAEELTGFTQLDAQGRPLDDVLTVVDGTKASELARSALTGALESRDATIQGKDGRRFTVSAKASPIQQTSGQRDGFVIVFRDVAKERQLFESMQRAARLESLGVLAAGIAHDFNNLLSSLYGHLELARDLASGDARSHLDLAAQAFTRTKALTAQLLAFAKGGAPVRKTASVERTVRECVEFALSGSNVSAVLDVEPGLWSAEFDQHQIGQAIDNLVINAKQAMPQGGVVRVRVRNLIVMREDKASLQPGRYVEISIRDQGPGIPREQLPRIFDPFFTTKAGGNGLGLSVTYAIMKKHDGAVEVESDLGAGVTVRLFLPAASAAKVPTVPPKAAPRRGSGVVVVMDDEPAVRRVVTSMLKRLGYEPFEASEGSEVVGLVGELVQRGKRPAAVMLDLTVKAGRGGRDVVHELRELLPSVPIVASSGYSDDPVMARPLDYGFSASLPKPFLASELESTLSGLTARES